MISPKALQLLIPLYNSPGRHYHNLDHIHYLLSKLSEYQSNVPSAMPHPSYNLGLLWAIWFHDAIYSPFPFATTSNEKESVDLFQASFSEIYHDELIVHNNIILSETMTIAKNAILATEHHLKDWPESTHIVTQIMLDVDMAGFGEEYDRVYKTSDLILKEYAVLGYSRKVMLGNRVKFLETLLKKKRIYNTPYFYNTYEKKARANIAAVIENTKLEIEFVL
jgi:predicted metal-dependent HD superfamily phosphohydrolase